MMSHYMDIDLLPDTEFSPALLMGALYAKLHRALARLKEEGIGVSFPCYRLKPRTLGEKLRLHGESPALQQLQATNWLQGMRDHVRQTEILPVPASVAFRAIKRRQYKTNVERLRRRRMRRQGESHEQTVVAIPATIERKPELPYITLHSQSTGQTFHLFIELGQAQSDPTPGRFNSYGLSQTATLPWF